jgi:hypothetical protein
VWTAFAGEYSPKSIAWNDYSPERAQEHSPDEHRPPITFGILGTATHYGVQKSVAVPNGTKLRELWLKMRFLCQRNHPRFPIKRGSCCDSKAVNYA